MKLWIVGKVLNWPVWEFAGIFSTEELAISKCTAINYFVAPATLDDFMIKEETMDWPGCYYPLLEKK